MGGRCEIVASRDNSVAFGVNVRLLQVVAILSLLCARIFRKVLVTMHIFRL